MKKKVLIFLLCISAFFGGILAGFLSSGKNKKAEQPTEIIAEEVIYEDETVAVEKVKEINYYFVRVNNDILTVLRIFDDGSEEEVMHTYINTTELPQTEINTLEEGVAFESMEDALMMAESFVS